MTLRRRRRFTAGRPEVVKRRGKNAAFSRFWRGFFRRASPMRPVSGGAGEAPPSHAEAASLWSLLMRRIYVFTVFGEGKPASPPRWHEILRTAASTKNAFSRSLQ